jgi:hypothetical protein
MKNTKRQFSKTERIEYYKNQALELELRIHLLQNKLNKALRRIEEIPNEQDQDWSERVTNQVYEKTGG